MELERGGAMGSPSPASSGRLGSAGRAAGSSGLEVAYHRLEAKRIAEAKPAFGQKLASWFIPLFVLLGTTGGLMKIAHRRGGQDLRLLVPHAFDASSTPQSGAFAIVTLMTAIAVGFAGFKKVPRSHAMLGSSAAFLVASLAMVTVTLVSTDEHPAPPDGALLIPYVVPLGLALLGLGVVGRGPPLFLAGGSRRIGALVAALFGGAIVFVAIEISALAARIP